MRVQFLAHLVAGQSDLVGIDDDHVVTGIGVRRVGRLVLAAQQRGDLSGQTTEHHVGGVDDVPVMSQIGWFRSESFHWCTFSCLLCSGLGLPRWSGLAVSASLSVGSLKVLDGEWESALKDPLGKHNNPL